jgi:hypothetical protein
MTLSIITNENNMYTLSNESVDKADKFIVHKNILYVFPKDFGHPLFHSFKAIIAIPYFMIDNVIYHDEYGKALFNYILYKKGIGSPCVPPPDPPLTIEDYNVLQRNYSLVGDHISKESTLI